jgi:hypothetical protein
MPVQSCEESTTEVHSSEIRYLLVRRISVLNSEESMNEESMNGEPTTQERTNEDYWIVVRYCAEKSFQAMMNEVHSNEVHCLVSS